VIRRPVFAANWKMNLGPAAGRAFMSSFLAAYTPRDDRTVMICPPAISFTAVRDALGGRTDILLGVQNVHWEEKGAFTGEISAPLAKEAGAAAVLVGHSERRHVFGETDAETARKCRAVARAGLIPVLCVGETVAQRESGETEQVVLRQLDAGVSELDAAQRSTLVIAYEPVWAIGTGRTATPEDASTVHREIREWLECSAGDGAQQIPILYGGSVNKGNAAALLAAAEVDGLLVGGASMDPEGWTAICRT
jgi:triosephosphate isomerase (TIM)